MPQIFLGICYKANAKQSQKKEYYTVKKNFRLRFYNNQYVMCIYHSSKLNGFLHHNVK